MVFGSTMLEIALGLTFVYLLMSVLCSALAEFVELFAKFRARDLEKGIRQLLDDPELAQMFFDHPMIKPLFKGNRLPSYIPAHTFSLALWNMATAAAEGTPASIAGVTKDIKALRATITQLPPERLPDHLKGTLVTLIDEAGGNFDKARANVEAWYDSAMDRVSGRYKRRTHWILLIIGLLLSVYMNVDTINIVKALSHNSELRAAVAGVAENYAKAPLPGTTPTPSAPATATAATTTTTTATPTPTATTAPGATEAGAGAPVDDDDATPTPTPSAAEQFAVASERINNIRGKLSELGLPIGWVFEPKKDDPKYLNDRGEFDPAAYDKAVQEYVTDPRRIPTRGEFPTKAVGLLLTAFAISQGAPFWFDLLNKIIVIRSTVKPREKSREQPSKDKPAPETEVDGDEEEDKG